MTTTSSHEQEDVLDATIAREITQCWLAHTLLSIARRLRSISVSDAATTLQMELLSILPPSAGDSNRTGNDPLAALVRALQKDHSGEDSDTNTDASLVTIHTVDDITRLPPLLVDGDGSNSLFIVCCESTGDADDTWPRLQRLLNDHHHHQNSTTWVYVAYHTGGIARVAVHHPSTKGAIPKAVLKTALQPLKEFQRQCSLPMALELFSKLRSSSPTHSHGSSLTKPTPKPASSILAAPGATQLPFQLVLMLLRWTYFHPHILALLIKPFTRKLALIPQPRVQQQVLALYQQHHKLWTEIYPERLLLSTQRLELLTLSPASRQQQQQQLRLPRSATSDEEDKETLPPPPLGRRLSQCKLWDLQKQFYRDQGIHAWSDHLIPFGVSSSSYLAMQYARLAIDFLRIHVTSTGPPSSSSPSPNPHRVPNCFVWEAASGSCKFLHAFLIHFYELLDEDQLEQRLGVVPCVIASDLSDQVLASREEMACFQQYITDGKLDFAFFDTDTFLHGSSDSQSDGDGATSKRHHLYLRHAKKSWHVAREKGPVFIIGNYFFDSLRTDVFVVTQQHSQSQSQRDNKARLQVREALIDPRTSTIPDMLFHLSVLKDGLPVYTQPFLNTTFAATLQVLETQWAAPTVASTSTSTEAEAAHHSSLVLFPVEAIAFLHAVLCQQDDDDDKSKLFPVAVITGDATFSFHDAVPRSFVDEESGDLEIPQLSPHPDCFCLPVDLEILQLFVSTTSGGGGGSSSSIVSTPSSDTFNVFFAQSPVSSSSHSMAKKFLEKRFYDVLNAFTPCDCDLLWGMMSVDGGAKHLSFQTQIALLAQTAWDFDMFTVVQWPLFHQWETQRKQQQDLDHQGNQIERARLTLIDAGRRSLRTFYVLDERKRSDEASLTVLQLARWFYELGAFQDVVAVLGVFFAWETGHVRLRSGACYLLGLATYHQHDFWAALSWLRKSLVLDPNRSRLQKWVAKTLFQLQKSKLVQHAKGAAK